MTLSVATLSRPQLRQQRVAGYSLTEMIVVITTLGILATVAISQFVGTSDGTKYALAHEKLEMLNRAVHMHQQSNGKDNLESLLPVAGATWDEMKVLLQLQYRNADNPAPGSPYAPLNYRPATSSDTSFYRMAWTGTLYKLLMPGEAGSGIKVVFDGSDMGPHVTFPPGYKWSGR